MMVGFSVSDGGVALVSQPEQASGGGDATMVGHWISGVGSVLAVQGWSVSQGRSVVAEQQWWIGRTVVAGQLWRFVGLGCRPAMVV